MSKLKICVEETALSLEWQMQKLALDVDGLKSAISSFKEVIPALANKIKEQSSMLFDSSSENIQMKEITSDKNEISKIISNNSATISFSDSEKLLIVIPEGFNTTFLNALYTYNSTTPEIFKFVNATLLEYNFMLSSFITNKDNKISNKDHTVFYRKVTDTRETFLKQISKHYKESDKTFNYLGSVIDRFADIELIHKELVKLNKLNDEFNINKLKNNVRQSCELIDIICKNANDDSVANISNVTINNLSVGAYEIAKLIEFIALYKFKIEQLTVAIQKTLDIIKKAIQK